MFEVQLYAKDSQGSLQAVGMSPEGSTVLSTTPGIARQTNPTAVSDGESVVPSFDDLGRQLTIPYQVRDLIFTARASLSTGTETTLFAGVAGAFHDLIWVSCSNNSNAATTVNLRSETGGGIVKTINVGANTDVTINYELPYPQNTAAATWTANLPDITGTTIVIDALFIRNV